MKEATLYHSEAGKREPTNKKFPPNFVSFLILSFVFIYFSFLFLSAHTQFAVSRSSKQLAPISKTILKLMKWITLGIMHTVSGLNKPVRAVFHSGAMIMNPQDWYWIIVPPELCIIGGIFQVPGEEEEKRKGTHPHGNHFSFSFFSLQLFRVDGAQRAD